MAKAAAKNRLKKNNARLRRLRLAIVSCDGVYILLHAIRLAFKYETLTKSPIITFIVFNAIQFICYLFLRSIAAPTYANGDLVDGGEDLSKPGIVEYTHDIIGLSALVQLGWVFSAYSLLLYPIYAFVTLAMWYSSRRRDQPLEMLSQNPAAGGGRKARRAAKRKQWND